MRVLVLSHLFPDPTDPTLGIYVLGQMRALRNLGTELSAIAPRPWVPPFFRSLPRFRRSTSVHRRLRYDGFAVEYPQLFLPGGRFFYLYGWLYYMQCRHLLRRELLKGRIDLIHAHTIMPDGFAAVLLGAEFKLPVVCTLHGSDLNLMPHLNRLNRWATKWALQRVDHLIAVSDDMRQKIYALSGRSDVKVIYNGADPDIFTFRPKMEARQALGLPAAQKIVLFVGRLVAVKALEALLAAVALPSAGDIVLYLVGEGECRASLEALAGSLGVLQRCHFIGRRTHEEVAQWLSAADCLVLPSKSEGMPTILIEAMLCRTPIVATRVGGVPEIVRDGETGLLVPYGNVSAMADAIEKVLHNPKLADSLSHQAEAEARSNVIWEANARKMLALYQGAVDRVSAAAPPAAWSLPVS